MRVALALSAAAIVVVSAGLGASAAPARHADAGAWAPSVRVGQGEISGLAVSPRNPRIVYASSFFRGVFKSTDGGRTWRRLAVSGQRYWSVAINPLRPATVYAGVTGGVSISRNQGASWSKRIRCCGIEVFAFAFDPRDPQVAFAGGDGVSKSNDGGWTWIEMGRNTIGGSHVNALAVDPRSPDTIYAGVGGGGGSEPGEELVSGVFKTRPTAARAGGGPDLQAGVSARWRWTLGDRGSCTRPTGRACTGVRMPAGRGAAPPPSSEAATSWRSWPILFA